MTANDDTLSITLKLGSHILPMTVRRQDEEIYRDAEKMINQRFTYYATNYPKLSNEMYLTMMALDVAVRLKSKERETDPQPMVNAMKGLISELEEALAEGEKG